MKEIGISEARAKYNTSHFGNPPCKVGNIVWIRVCDEKGIHEYLAQIREDTSEETEKWGKINLIREGKASPEDFGW